MMSNEKRVALIGRHLPMLVCNHIKVFDALSLCLVKGLDGMNSCY